MAWGKGDNSRANTISDARWYGLQKRARQANPRWRDDVKAAQRGRDNLRQAERGNN
jgi:hypothetical protein